MSRHTFRLGIIAIALAAAAGCGVGNAALIERDVIEETLPFESGDLFSIENVNGRVTIDTWEEESVRIEAEKRASSKRRLERTRVEIEETPPGCPGPDATSEGQLSARKQPGGLPHPDSGIRPCGGQNGER